MLEQLGKDGLAKIHGALSQTCPTPADPEIRIKSVNLNSNRSRLRPEVRPCYSLIWAEVGKFSPDSSVPLSPASEAANPASWIWRPSFERQRDFNPPEQRAAQRALRSPDE